MKLLLLCILHAVLFNIIRLTIIKLPVTYQHFSIINFVGQFYKINKTTQ